MSAGRMLSRMSLFRVYSTRPAALLTTHEMDSSGFSVLVQRLRDIIGRGYEVDEVKGVMKSYKALSEEYAKYVRWNPLKYTRNLIDQHNGLYNLMIMCWGPGHKAPIHSHPGANCFVRMLEGSMQERLYTKPKSPGAPVQLQRVRELVSGDVIHLRDDVSIHNMSTRLNESAVTLHLYTPPYDASEIFNEDTGQKQDAPLVYTTKGGVTQPQTDGVGL